MPAHRRTDLPRGAGIYRIVNLANGKCYVGSARNLAGRWRGHLCDLRQGKHHSVLLQRAWEKHGPDNFRFEVLESVPDISTLVAREQAHLDRLRTFDPAIGYNLQAIAASSLGRPVSAERRARISRALMGRKRSPEECAAVAAGLCGLRHRPETIEKMRAAKIGKPRSEECKRKISETKRGVPPSEKLRAAYIRLAKVKPADKTEIARLRRAGLRLKEIAERFGVSVPTVHRVLAMQDAA